MRDRAPRRARRRRRRGGTGKVLYFLAFAAFTMSCARSQLGDRVVNLRAALPSWRRAKSGFPPRTAPSARAAATPTHLPRPPCHLAPVRTHPETLGSRSPLLTRFARGP